MHLLVPLDLSEVTFNGILHSASTRTALLRSVLACLLAAACEVYADPVWATSASLLCLRSQCFTDGPPPRLHLHFQFQPVDSHFSTESTAMTVGWSVGVTKAARLLDYAMFEKVEEKRDYYLAAVSSGRVRDRIMLP